MILKLLLSIFNALPIIERLWAAFRRSTQKSPADEQAKADQAHDEAAKNAETKDDTSGSFGGSGPK